MSFPAIQLAELGRQPTYMLARILRILNSSPTIRLFALRVWIYELRSKTYRFDFSIIGVLILIDTDFPSDRSSRLEI